MNYYVIQINLKKEKDNHKINIFIYLAFFRTLTGDAGVLLRLLPASNNFSDTYSEILLLLSKGDEGLSETGDFSSRIFFAVSISMILSDAFFLLDFMFPSFDLSQLFVSDL